MDAKVIDMVGRVPVLGSALQGRADIRRIGGVIRSGVAAGMLKRSRNYVNGYWLGHYELGIQELLKQELKPARLFMMWGPMRGFHLVAAKLVGPTGKCVAFDPSPEMTGIREQQAQWAK
jgi:hypothetical protein